MGNLRMKTTFQIGFSQPTQVAGHHLFLFEWFTTPHEYWGLVLDISVACE